MSIALDTALYLRDQKQSNNISLVERAFLLTLCFRLGSNAVTWVSQKDLSIELNISERHVRRLAAGLSRKGYILVQKDNKNKKRNLYSIATFLHNYHETRKTESFTKTYPQGKKGVKHRTNTSSSSKNIGHNCPINAGQECPIQESKNESQPIENENKNEQKNSPKGKYKATNIKENILRAQKARAKRKVVNTVKATEITDDFQIEECHKIWEPNLDLEYERLQFIDHWKSTHKKFVDWSARFRLWLRKAAKDQITKGAFNQKKSESKNEVRSIVPDAPKIEYPRGTYEVGTAYLKDIRKGLGRGVFT